VPLFALLVQTSDVSWAMRPINAKGGNRYSGALTIPTDNNCEKWHAAVLVWGWCSAKALPERMPGTQH
jgi:hypothetical protein